MSEEDDPLAAMARDTEMLDSAEAGNPGIRLYRWRSVCATLGRFQRPEAALVDGGSVRWAHRPTGGSAVLHGHDVTLSVAIPLTGRWDGVKAVYRRLTRLPIELLRQNGVEALLAGDLLSSAPSSSLTPYCFATVSKMDIVDRGGRKVCGCALRVTRNAALLQTSIPIATPSVDPGSVLRGATPVAIHSELTAESFDAAELGRLLELCE